MRRDPVEYQVVFSGRDSLTPDGTGLGSSLAPRIFAVRR